ncbi:hypothetical protein CN556_00140 [Bacillus wiedmannii]|nr:hypothetical protein CN604_18305 [Bacillus wiedmannii]PEN99728.1 hypothetical protein CN556_00140 [Bacillus wiedmannii]
MNHSSLSYLKKSLNPTIPVLPIGIFRYFWAIACVCIGASPNRLLIFLIFCSFRVKAYPQYLNLSSIDKTYYFTF